MAQCTVADWYVCVYIYTNIRIRFIRIHTHTRLYTQSHTRTHKCTHMYAQMPCHAHTHAHRHPHESSNTEKRANITPLTDGNRNTRKSMQLSVFLFFFLGFSARDTTSQPCCCLLLCHNPGNELSLVCCCVCCLLSVVVCCCVTTLETNCLEQCAIGFF